MTQEQETEIRSLLDERLGQQYITGLSQGSAVMAKMVLDMLNQPGKTNTQKLHKIRAYCHRHLPKQVSAAQAPQEVPATQ